ncbi:MAG: Asp23/Gls24 family envelope stress response protein [Firmicutes bacterium]|nr:Asp23/Gls24 family envelope stress response protein [Bacillota bacterium]
MIIYGLSGKSGTGKSYNAIELCVRMQIEAIVDDGLFIDQGTIIAGVSAKKQKSKMRAIKTAIFEDEEQAAEVRAAIERCAPKSILVLGTSDRMVDIIAGRLGLPPVTEYIHIEDITTEAQRSKAIDARARGGMHVIPAPTIQVRKQFSGYFLDPKRSFRKTRAELGDQAGEKTVVRPKYSYFGKFEISEKVINDITSHIVSETPGAAQLLMSSSTADSDNNMYIRAVVTVEWGRRVLSVARQLQKSLVEAVTAMTGFNILGVEIEVRGFK